MRIPKILEKEILALVIILALENFIFGGKVKTNSKSLGGAFERRIARELSTWMYDDPNVLKREPTSGAAKDNYVGDIYPAKQLLPGQQSWRVLVECKCGYSQFTPTLLNYSIIEKWYLKSLLETKQSELQKNVIIIANFKNKKGILLCTNLELNVCCKCVLCIKNNGDYEYVYCYDYNELLKHSFIEVFGGKI